VKTRIGFALGTMLSVGAMDAASAAGTSGAAPAPFPAGIEVIVVTAKRPAPPIAATEAIYEVVVTAKRATNTNARPTPPAAVIETPKVELAIADGVIRL